jgi:rRNA maturation endonuclease Nob1
MENIDPQTVQVLSVGVAAAAMIVLSRAKSMLGSEPLERCASCSRIFAAGRRCPHCG